MPTVAGGLTVTVCVVLLGGMYLAAMRTTLNPIATVPIPAAVTAQPDELTQRLRAAADPNGTVIITTVNSAWAAPGGNGNGSGMLDLFLQTMPRHLRQHLLLVAVDAAALSRCREVHPHCYALPVDSAGAGPAYAGPTAFMSAKYVDMMWRRLRFFGEILDRGFSFLFSDVDILWLRDPLPLLTAGRSVPDMQFACDQFRGASSSANAGFMFVRSGPRTRQFVHWWHASRARFPAGTNEQDVLNSVKGKELPRRGISVRFLDTRFFGGFCQQRMKLHEVVTLHANCCLGLHVKMHDLQLVLASWAHYSNKTTQAAAASSQLDFTEPAYSCRATMSHLRNRQHR